MSDTGKTTHEHTAALLTVAATNLMVRGYALEEATNAAWDIFRSLEPLMHPKAERDAP